MPLRKHTQTHFLFVYMVKNTPNHTFFDCVVCNAYSPNVPFRLCIKLKPEKNCFRRICVSVLYVDRVNKFMLWIE